MELRDGFVWVWKARDDLQHKHGVWFRHGARRVEPAGSVRWVFIYRWSNGRVRCFDREYPHRLQMTAEEVAALEQRKTASCLKRARDAEGPPLSTCERILRRALDRNEVERI